MSYAIQSKINAMVPKVLEIVIVVSSYMPVYLFFPFIFSIFGVLRVSTKQTRPFSPLPLLYPPTTGRYPADPCIALSFCASRIDIIK